MARKIPARSEIERQYTWNAESLFASPAAWEKEVAAILAELPAIRALEGILRGSAAALAEGLARVEGMWARTWKIFVYSDFSYSADTTDTNAAAMNDRAQSAYGAVGAATSFVEPEILEIGRETLVRWMEEEPRLRLYEHYLDGLERKKSHIRSSEVEEVMGMLADPFCGPSNASSMLLNADFQFPDAVDGKGKKLPLSQGTLSAILSNPDQEARRSAWTGYMSMHFRFRNTLAAILGSSIRQCVFDSRVRRFDSSLAGALFSDAVPTEVFHNAIDIFQRNLPVWHRYFNVRRKALGLKKLHHYDMWAPLARKRTRLSYERTIELICEGLAPMGMEYVETVRTGCLRDRWVDPLPSKGKREGALSGGSYGTLPFIMMNFTEDISSLSTLAHELGHSMHSYLTWKHQPYVYSSYSTFAGEVASNFHQALVRDSLLKGETDENLRIEVIEEGMENYFRYLFIMPVLAQFELDTHQRVERGEPLTADHMMDLMTGMLTEAYGEGVGVEREREGLLWAAFTHLFRDYYVFRYETGIAGAQALAGRVLRGEENAVADYLGFLSAGSSLYPLDALARAGVDLTRPEPIQEAFSSMGGFIDQLEELLF
jgi:oligoendopeptidase F